MDFLYTDNIPVIPSQMALLETREKLAYAKSSHELLKKMLDELSHTSRQTQEKIAEMKLALQEKFEDASLSMAHARFDAGDFSQQVLENVEETIQAQYRVQIETEKTQAGVATPKFKLVADGPDANSLVGLSKGGVAIAKAKEHHLTLLEELMGLATLQARYVEVHEESGKIRLRVNIIEQVAIPNLERTLVWITEELDDNDREEFYRRKRIMRKKHGDRVRDVDAPETKVSANSSRRARLSAAGASPLL